MDHNILFLEFKWNLQIFQALFRGSRVASKMVLKIMVETLDRIL